MIRSKNYSFNNNCKNIFLVLYYRDKFHLFYSITEDIIKFYLNNKLFYCFNSGTLRGGSKFSRDLGKIGNNVKKIKKGHSSSSARSDV